MDVEYTCWWDFHFATIAVCVCIWVLDTHSKRAKLVAAVGTPLRLPTQWAFTHNWTALNDAAWFPGLTHSAFLITHGTTSLWSHQIHLYFFSVHSLAPYECTKPAHYLITPLLRGVHLHKPFNILEVPFSIKYKTKNFISLFRLHSFIWLESTAFRLEKKCEL
jgi:hypothetical protein